ncbi:hypothetical protein [Deinococcus humi]|uniref:Uncharacterized protein n=1 Tax=Deinococcus humi TaxID=662880 RepID=A0A7W8JZK8_9DEIO|nr:hypothetical protein [Deinococcus humi]MBB5365753.1 hypothetical protein [Deinococcus humi]GGO38342.1 hypothetical protein GCM10008949_44700 [Deinococcus humi]
MTIHIRAVSDISAVGQGNRLLMLQEDITGVCYTVRDQLGTQNLYDLTPATPFDQPFEIDGAVVQPWDSLVAKAHWRALDEGPCPLPELTPEAARAAIERYAREHWL